MQATATVTPTERTGAQALQGLVSQGEPIDGLREKILELLETQKDAGLTRDQVAAEAGMSPATLSMWLNGKYPGNNGNMERKLLKWMDAREERAGVEALIPDPPEFFLSRTASELMNAFRYAQSLTDMVAVMGVPGIGKSVTCAAYQRQYPNVWIPSLASHTTGVVPVLKRICRAVGAAESPGASGLAEAIAQKIEGTRGLLIVDEAHHASVAALDAIRAIHDDTGVAVALVGDLTLGAKLEQMPQLYSRLGARLFRRRVLKADVEALVDAWGITRKAERSFLAEIAERPGALRSVTKVLRLATAVAHGDGEPLSLAHLEDAALTLSARATSETEHV